MKKALLLLAVFCLLIPLPATVQGQKADYSMLDGNPYNPKTDPDIDLFMGHWKDSEPRHIYGALIERDILTKSAGNPMKPHTRSAVLTLHQPPVLLQPEREKQHHSLHAQGRAGHLLY